MVPKYKKLLVGSLEGIEAVQRSYVPGEADFSHPDEVGYVLGIVNPVLNLDEVMLWMFNSDFQLISAL